MNILCPRTDAGAPAHTAGQLTSEVYQPAFPAICSSPLSVEDVLRSGDPANGLVSRCLPPGGSFYCIVCRLACSGPQPWQQHLRSAKHIKKSQAGTMPSWLERTDGEGTAARPALTR